jgi:hypothetical protein
MDCPFKSLTGLPCPGCGYTRSVESILGGEFLHSFLHNPGWLVLIFFLGTMIVIGIRSMIKGRQVILKKGWLIVFIVLLAGTWLGKFLLGASHY